MDALWSFKNTIRLNLFGTFSEKLKQTNNEIEEKHNITDRYWYQYNNRFIDLIYLHFRKGIFC